MKSIKNFKEKSISSLMEFVTGGKSKTKRPT